jgi:hypothetical protein
MSNQFEKNLNNLKNALCILGRPTGLIPLSCVVATSSRRVLQPLQLHCPLPSPLTPHAQGTLKPHPASSSIRAAAPFLAPFSTTARALATAIFTRSMSSPATSRFVAPRPPPSSPSGAHSRHGAPRAHRIHQAALSRPRSEFLPPPVPCSVAAPFAVSAPCRPPSPQSTMPNVSPSLCEASGP